MATITLQKAYDDHASKQSGLDSARKALADWSAQQTSLTQAVSTAQADADHAETVLEQIVASVPSDKVVETSDGTILIILGGTLHTYTIAQAGDVSGDDGSGDTTPPPAPEPTPVPAPAPEPLPSPTPTSPDVPVVGPTDTPPGFVNSAGF